MKVAITLLLSIFPSFVYALPPRSIDITVLRGIAAINLTKSQAKKVFRDAAARIKSELGINVKANRWIDLPMQNLPSEEGFKMFDRAYKAQVRRSIDNAVVLLAAPPINHAENRFEIMGIASICNPLYGVASVALAWLKHWPGHELEHSTAALVHELGHLLGAQHDNSENPQANYMNSQVAEYVAGQNFTMNFADKARGEINSCFKEWKIK